MTPSELPADVRRLILTSIPSVPYLEAVLLLRTHPEQAWDAAQLSRRLYVSERTAHELMALLRAGAVVEEAGQALRYAPTAELGALIDQLAQVYSRDLVAVTDLIHSRIDRRAQQFADAFRFRKE